MSVASIANDLPFLSYNTHTPPPGPGDYSIEETAFWSERVYTHVFRLLNEYSVVPEAILLKPNMCLPGGCGTLSCGTCLHGACMRAEREYCCSNTPVSPGALYALPMCQHTQHACAVCCSDCVCALHPSCAPSHRPGRAHSLPC